MLDGFRPTAFGSPEKKLRGFQTQAQAALTPQLGVISKRRDSIQVNGSGYALAPLSRRTDVRKNKRNGTLRCRPLVDLRERRGI